MAAMNAADQARTLQLAQAIASAASLFREQFPDARANLNPWRDDPQTRAFGEPETVDLSFHFPGWSPRIQCRSVLVQLRLAGPPGGLGGSGRPPLLGVTLRGLTYAGERWSLATVGDWRASGAPPPHPRGGGDPAHLLPPAVRAVRRRRFPGGLSRRLTSPQPWSRGRSRYYRGCLLIEASAQDPAPALAQPP
jgi:hypothetical protein